MNRRTYIAVLVALVVVAAALMWLGGARRASANTIQPDRNSLALVPVQATTILGVDVDALRATPVYATWQQRTANRRHDAGYDEFLARTGFDIERDLAAVTAAAWKVGDRPEFLAVATARFNPSAVSSFLKEKGGTMEIYNGVELLIPDSGHAKPGEDYPALVLQLADRPNTILAGSSAAVKQALDLRANSGFSALSNQALLDRVQKIGAENQIWAVSTAPGAFLPSHLPLPPQANAARVLQGLRGSTVAVNAAGGLRLLMEGACANADDARTLADAARGILAMLRLMAPANQPEVLQALNSFQVEQRESDVRLTAQIPQQLLDELAQKPGMFLPHGHSHPAQQQQHR